MPNSLIRSASDTFAILALVEDNAKIIIQKGTSEIFHVDRAAIFEHSQHFKDAVMQTYRASQENVAYQGNLEPWIFGVFDIWLRRDHELDKKHNSETCLMLSDFKYIEKERRGSALQRKVVSRGPTLSNSVLQGMSDHWYWLFSWSDLYALYEFAMTYTNRPFQRAVIMDIRRKCDYIAQCVLAGMPESKMNIIKEMTATRLITTAIQAAGIEDFMDSWTADILWLSDFSVSTIELLPALALRFLRAWKCGPCGDPSRVCNAADHTAVDRESPFRRLWCRNPSCVHQGDLEEDKVLCTLFTKAKAVELKHLIL